MHTQCESFLRYKELKYQAESETFDVQPLDGNELIAKFFYIANMAHTQLNGIPCVECFNWFLNEEWIC